MSTKAKPEPDKTKLTDAECDFILDKVLLSLENAVLPIDFFRGMGRGVIFGVNEEDKQRVRGLIRLVAHGE